MRYLKKSITHTKSNFSDYFSSNHISQIFAYIFSLFSQEYKYFFMRLTYVKGYQKCKMAGKEYVIWMTKLFYFMLKTISFLKKFTFLPWVFGHAKNPIDKKAIVNYKFYDVTCWKRNNYNLRITQYLKN